MRYKKLRQFTDELDKQAAAPTSSLAQDFAGGLDPFGTFTSQYGQKAQAAGLSEAEHAKKRGISTAGGVIGGGILLPGAISGVIGGAKGLSGGGSISQRLARAGAGAREGFVAPFKGLATAARAQKALGVAEKGQRLNASQVQAVKDVAGQARLSSVAGAAGEAPGRIKAMIGALKGRRQLAKLDKGMVSPEVAAALRPQIRSATNEGLATLGMGAGVGGLGAYVQYGKGRAAEKDFQERMKKQGSAKKKSMSEKVAEITYRGRTFPGYNRPIASDRPQKKKMVLAKKGEKVKLIHFGQKGYKHNYSDSAKKSYLARSGGIRGKGGQLTAKDKFSANYWARKELWPSGKADGSTASSKKRD
jgi:hypothetical protein